MNESPPVIRKVVSLHPKATESVQQSMTTSTSEWMVYHLLQLDMLARHLIFFLTALPSLMVLGLLFGVMSTPLATLPISVLAISVTSWLFALGFALASLLFMQYTNTTHNASPATQTHCFHQLSLKKRYLLIMSSLLSFFAGVLLIFSLSLSLFP